jgi:hypothetical protein
VVGYGEVAGVFDIGVGGLATKMEPGVAIAAGAHMGRWSLGLVGDYSRLAPSYPDHYAYFLLCPRCLDCACPSQPQLAASRFDVDVQARGYLVLRSRVQPFVEGRCGWSRIAVSGNPRGAFTDFTMNGLHLGAAMGGRTFITRQLAGYLSVGYSFSLVKTPPTFLSGAILETDLIYISNHADAIETSVGVTASF